MVPEELSTASDLKEAIKARLMHSGTWADMQARLRAEIFHSLNDRTIPTPEKTEEMALAFDIITDFLAGMKLDNTRSVFTEEIGGDSDNVVLVDRHKLSREVGVEIADNQGDVPLLLLLIQHLRSQRKGAR